MVALEQPAEPFEKEYRTFRKARIGLAYLMLAIEVSQFLRASRIL